MNEKNTLKVANDFMSLITNIKCMDSGFELLTKSKDKKYNIIFYNIVKNCAEVGFCDLPWTYFNSIGIPDVEKYINLFVENNKIYKLNNYYYIPNQNNGQCRQIVVKDNEKDKIIAKSLYENMMQYRRPEMSSESIRKFKKEYKDSSDKQDIKLSHHPIIDYISYLNNVTIPKEISLRCEKARHLFTDQKDLIIDIMVALISGKKYIIHQSKESINYRIGGMFNNLPKEIRRFILNKEDGFVELDLKSAHLSFLCSKTDLELPENIVQLIADQTGLLKSQVKECLVRTIYGGKFSPKDGLILDQDRKALHDSRRNSECPLKNQEQEINDFNKICQNEYFIQIKDSVKKLINEIELNNGIMDVFGNFINKNDEIKSSTVMAAYYSSIEKRLMMKLLPLTHQGFRIISDEHDGCTIFISNPERKEEILKLCKNAVEKEAKKMNIKTTLEVK